jgi:hypothetical protein
MAARLTTYVVVAIVAATLIAGLIVGAQRDDSEGPVDLILHNASVYTADDDRTRAEAVAIRGNQILRVGAEREVLRLQRPQTILIDADGGTVLPGFNDAHLHLFEGGLNLEKADLLGAATVAEIQERVAAWANANPDEEWITGRGWRYETFQGGLPTRQMLDAIVGKRPALLLSHDGRSGWASSAALRLAGITSRTPHPVRGAIIKDADTSEPTGVLRETAIALVAKLVPAPTREERARALRSAIAEAHRHGITSVQNAGGNLDDFEVFAEARRAGDLRLRVYSALTLDGRVFTDHDRTRLLQAARQYPDDPLFKSGAVKLILDGAVLTHTAATLQPYGGRESTVEPLVPPDDLNRTVRLVDAEGWQIMTHATGDRAVRLALNAYAHAVRSNPLLSRERRHRIEHAETAQPLDIPRFGSLHVIASMQPSHGNPASAWFESWSRSLGSDRASRGWAYRSISGSGGRLAFGSDWPAADLDPVLGLYAAITERSVESLRPAGARIAEELTLEAAIDAYTSGAAWASFDEGRKGALAPGMLADVVVLSTDIFDSRQALARTQVAYTIFDGKVVYRRDRATN